MSDLETTANLGCAVVKSSYGLSEEGVVELTSLVLVVERTTKSGLKSSLS